MTLFRERLAQSLVLAGGAAFSGWTLMKLIPHSMLSFTLTQTSVAFLAIASLMVFIIAHHRRSGDLLDQRQEELTLIAAFGFLFFAMLMAWRALGKNDYAGGDMAANVPASPPRQDYSNSRGRSWPCSPNDAYCVVEEWSYY